MFDPIRDYLFSMACHLNKIRDSLSNQNWNIVSHLLKLYFYRGTQWHKEWEVHVFKAVSSVYKMRNNRYPGKEIILQALWGFMEDAWYDHYGSYVERVAIDLDDGRTFLDYSIIKCNPRPVETHDFIESYMDWLSERLSVAGGVLPLGVFEKIEGLLLAFPFTPEVQRGVFFNYR